MEIGPIPGIRGIPVSSRQGVLRPPAVFDVDASAKPGEDGGQKNGRKAAGAEENDQDDLRADIEEDSGTGMAEDREAQRVDTFV